MSSRLSLYNAVVPVAGLGTRMLPATKSQPKEMLPVGKRPVVQYIVEELEKNAFDRILFITGAGKHSIENHFDYDPVLIRYLRETGKEELLSELEIDSADLRFFYTRQRTQAGLGDAIMHAEEFAGRAPFAVALGDSILGRHAQSKTLSRMREIFLETSCAAIVAFETVPLEEVHQYGIAAPESTPEPGQPFVLRDVVEKPRREEAPSQYAIAARYIFSPAIFDALRETKPGKGGEIQLTDAIRLLIRSGEKVLGLPLPPGEVRFDIGNFESYFQAFIEFALTDPQLGAKMRDFTKELLEREG
jgi:UTP--glucose-1-phosphate uridylyltransferase